jgi:hypothetical protein
LIPISTAPKKIFIHRTCVALSGVLALPWPQDAKVQQQERKQSQDVVCRDVAVAEL